MSQSAHTHEADDSTSSREPVQVMSRYCFCREISHSAYLVDRLLRTKPENRIVLRRWRITRSLARL
jgi:hypothetical protein